jgi:two-component system OmpR family response regulator
MTRRIALVEDDDVILQNYADFLRGSHFEVDTYATKESALQGLQERPPDLAVLDISLNGERDAGFVICAAVRQQYPQLPIVFLTSHDGEVDKISGLRLGADDYLTKDTSMDFLVVRIEALLRRRDAYIQSPSHDPIRVPGTELQLDKHALTASWRGGRLDLTLTQFWILAEICREPGQARSHEELMRAASIVVEPNTIVAHIKAIREEFKRVDPVFDAIRTERGRGYRWLLS